MQPLFSPTPSPLPAARLLVRQLLGLLLAGLLLGTQLRAQPTLVKDINLKGADGNAPENLTGVGSSLFFTTDYGRKVWKSDGTEGGTVLVKDLYATAGSSFPEGFTVVNGTLFFTTSYGRDLWKSDGTAAGTVMIANNLNADYETFTGVNGTLFFTSGNEFTGLELWKSDGTAAGTEMVKDVYPGAAGSSLRYFTNLNGTLYFWADDGTHGFELWKSDGTPAGTVLVKDINPGAEGAFDFGSAFGFASLDGSFFFRARTDAHGYELWKSDGTAAGTVLVKDIRPGPEGSSPHLFIQANGTLFFTANDGARGEELWKTDGTSGGTVRVKDIWPGASGSSPRNLTRVGGTLFFAAYHQSNGAQELWKSDGSATGTVLVRDINPDDDSGHAPEGLTDFNGTLFFTATDGTRGRELWKSDGTRAGTVLVKEIVPGSDGLYGPKILMIFNNTLLFSAAGASGSELWRTDGTEAGTQMVRDIDPGVGSGNPNHFTRVNGTLFFTADDGTHGTEIWRTDGTEAGTQMVRDILEGSASAFDNPFDNPSTGSFTNVNGILFFKANNGTTPAALWRSDGTAAGTFQLTGFQPYYLTEAEGALFFINGNSTRAELWKSDGTVAGTAKVTDIYPDVEGVTIPGLFYTNGSVFFITGNRTTSAPQGTELWKSDGTAAGTVKLKRLMTSANANTPSPFGQRNGTLYFGADGFLWKSDGTAAGTVKLKEVEAGYFTEMNGTLFFQGSDSHGAELWKSDGTAAGTVRVKDIHPGAASSLTCCESPGFVEVNGSLYFRAWTAAGPELWKSDGTAAGTVMVKDIWPGANGSTPSNLTASGGMLYFDGNTVTGGQELWKSDGTAAGTVLVKDITPGAGSSYVSNLTDVNGTLYFRAQDGTRGWQLWQSDGTAEGTRMVADVVQRPVGVLPGDLTNVDGTLFFSAQGGPEGRELWKYNPEGASPAFRINAGGGSFTAGSGEVFAADGYARGGSVTTPVNDNIARTEDDALYRQARYGERFTYSLPTGNGTYYVVLHFAETYWGHQTAGGVGSRQFHVDVEEARKLTDYDIFARAGGSLRAVQEAFRTEVRDGVLDIRFSRGAADFPLVAAIEVFEEDAFRLNVAGSAYRSPKGWFLSDFYGSGGTVSQYAPGEVSRTDDDELYRSNRHGSLFHYNLPTGPGTFRVTLHFNETYWGNLAAGGTGARRFNVNAEGERKLTGYDTYAEAGGAMTAVQEQFSVTVTDQVLNLAFLTGRADGSVDFAHVAAIEVVRQGSANARMAAAQPPATESPVVRMYPNPAEATLTVRLPFPASQVDATAVRDATGRTLLINAHRRAGEKALQVDVSSLKPGLYLLLLQSAQGGKVIKFAKQALNH